MLNTRLAVVDLWPMSHPRGELRHANTDEGGPTTHPAQMHAEVPRDHVAAAGGVGAEWAAVGAVAGVRAHVDGQVVGSRERLAAIGALERSVARVHVDVPIQHVGPRERSLAVATDVRGRVAARG